MSRKASNESALRSFVEHHAAMRERFDALLQGGALTNADVTAHHEWQKAEIARFDAWLVAAGWTRAELFELLRSIAAEIKAEDGSHA